MLSNLSQQIEPFHVMEVVKRADELEQAGASVIHLSIGEPDFSVPKPVAQALAAACEGGKTRYTAALGLPQLRAAISTHYRTIWQVQVPAEQIVVTSGASAALLYACLSLINPHDKVGITDPGYPCNKSFIQTAGGQPQLIQVHETNNFQPDAVQIQQAYENGMKGLILASPSNPTGTRISQARQADILEQTWAHNGFLIMDEIYQELVYGAPSTSLLQIHGAPTQDKPFVVINSFSKYFGMTGLRLGWMVVPPEMVLSIEKLAQNLAICPNTPTQHAALACFEPETLKICEERRQLFEKRRDILLQGIEQTGLELASQPDGAFYIYLKTPYSSDQYCLDLLEKTGVCTVPGKDFSKLNGDKMMRISYANSAENILEALDRIKQFNQALPLA